MISQDRLMAILTDLPVVHLDLIDLSWKLIGEDGNLDPEKIAINYTEMETAIAQAESYARDTKEMAQCLIRLLR